jgi:very-short-patch-repair endonuclease
MGADRWLAAAELSRKQFGVISSSQLSEGFGVSRSALRAAVTGGRLQHLFRSIYRFPGASDDWRQHAFAATLIAGPESALSHQTAAMHLQLLTPQRASTIHVSVPNRRSVTLPPRFVVHRPTHPFLRIERLGLPTTSPVRTIVDLAGVLDEAALEGVLDDAHHLFPGMGATLEALLARLNGTLAGIGTLRTLLAERQGQATESPLERKVWRTLRSSNLPRPRVQFELHADDEYVMKIDFAWPAHRIALHVDGFRWHGRRTNFDTDARQRTRLAVLGWTNVMLTSRSLRDDRWLRELARLLRERSPQHRLPF